MRIPTLIDMLRVEGQLLGDAAQRAGTAAAVPTCPDWTVRDLLLHIGGVHRWAARTVAEARTERIDVAQPYDIVDELPADDELVDWYRAGHAGLVTTLQRAPEDLDCWRVFAAPSAKAFWARRQAHETAVHRADADFANGPGTAAPLDPAFAADGVDELVTGFVSGRARRLASTPPVTLGLATTDTGDSWTVRIGEDGPVAERGGGAADVTVSGRAATLYLVLWNRLPWTDVTVVGDDADRVTKLWTDTVHIRWAGPRKS